MPIERADWNGDEGGSGPTGTALVPAQDGSAHETAVSTDQDDGGGWLDAEDSARYRKLLADGIMTRDELGRIFALTEGELNALSKPSARLGRASIEAELAQIAERRRTDSRAYFKDEAMQARERELIVQKQALAAKRADRPEDDIRVGDLSRREIDAELEQIAKHRRENKVAYYRDDKMQARERELMDAREQAKELAVQIERVTTAVDAILDAVPDAQEFQSGFDRLPESARAAVSQELARPAEDPARPASEADLKRFASTEEGAQLVREWGNSAGRKLAILRTRLERFYRSGGDVEAASVWLDDLPSAQAKVVWKALAG